MSRMKKVLALGLACGLLLTACGGKDAPADNGGGTTAPADSQAETTDAAETPAEDKGAADSGEKTDTARGMVGFHGERQDLLPDKRYVLWRSIPMWRS